MAEAADDTFLPGAPVRTAVQDPLDLPVVARTPIRTRALGLVMMAAALAGAPAALLLAHPYNRTLSDG